MISGRGNKRGPGRINARGGSHNISGGHDGGGRTNGGGRTDGRGLGVGQYRIHVIPGNLSRGC